MAVVGLGALFERLGLDVYPVAVMAVMVGIVISSIWVPDAVPEQRPELDGQGGFLRQLCRPGVLAFFVSVGLMQVSHGPYYTFFSIHLEALGYGRWGWSPKSCCFW